MGTTLAPKPAGEDDDDELAAEEDAVAPSAAGHCIGSGLRPYFSQGQDNLNGQPPRPNYSAQPQSH